MRILLFVALFLPLVGCARPPRPRLRLARTVTIDFKNVRDGRCQVRDIQLDAQTGRQVVICE